MILQWWFSTFHTDFSLKYSFHSKNPPTTEAGFSAVHDKAADISNITYWKILQ